MDALEDLDKIMTELELLDTQLTNNITMTYAKISQPPRHWWTKESHKANHLVRYLSAQISLKKNNIEALDTSLYLQTQLPTDLDIYQGDPNQKPSAQLCQAKKSHRQARQDSHKKQQQQLDQKIRKQKDTQDGAKIAKELRTIQKGETRKQLYANMAMIQQKQNKSSLPYINIPDKTKF